MLAEVGKRTYITSRTSGNARLPAKPYYAMAKIATLALFNDLRQNLLHLEGVLKAFGVHTEPTADSDAMGICYNCVTTENVTDKQVCDFSADAGKL